MVRVNLTDHTRDVGKNEGKSLIPVTQMILIIWIVSIYKIIERRLQEPT